MRSTELDYRVSRKVCDIPRNIAENYQSHVRRAMMMNARKNDGLFRLEDVAKDQWFQNRLPSFARPVAM